MQIVSEKERKIKMDKKEFALNQHEKWNGKIEVHFICNVAAG